MKSSSKTTPRYDLGLNPPYQINFRAKRSGKHISATKRRITFQFGFSSADAISRGLVEKECRGEEHEIVLVWSHMTGKRELFLDGRQVHMSKVSSFNSRFEYSWHAFGGHTVTVIANGTPPRRDSGERQFDLELDGMSFFEFSKIYQLGHSESVAKRASFVPSRANSYHGVTYDARDDEEEEEDGHLGVKIDLFETQVSSSSTLSPVSNYGSVPSLVGSATSSTTSYDEFTPVEQYNTQYNTQKTFESVSSEILCAYNNKAPNAQVPHSAPSSSRALVSLSEEGMDQISHSMKNLVNLDDITTTPVQPIAPNSVSLDTMKQGGANWSLVGRAPTLSEMRDCAAQSPGPSARSTAQSQPVQTFAPPPYPGAVAPPQRHYSAPGHMGYAPSY